MTRHSEILQEVVRILVREHPVIGVACHGSVLLGRARPDSDLDLIILVDAPGEYHNDHDATFEGITLCRSFFPKEWLERTLEERPYTLWPFSRARILYDTDGAMAAYQAAASAYFDRKPEIAAAWVERERNYRARKTDPSVDLAHPSWGEFFEWLRDNFDVT